MTFDEYKALCRAVLGYAGMKMAYTLKGVTVEEGDTLNNALAACMPEGFNERNKP